MTTGFLVRACHRPRPPVGRPAGGEAEEEQLERPGEDRDVADARREARELADAPVELLLVAEFGEVVVIGARSRAHRWPDLPEAASGVRAGPQAEYLRR